jgi:hypothetical protein
MASIEINVLWSDEVEFQFRPGSTDVYDYDYVVRFGGYEIFRLPAGGSLAARFDKDEFLDYGRQVMADRLTVMFIHSMAEVP